MSAARPTPELIAQIETTLRGQCPHPADDEHGHEMLHLELTRAELGAVHFALAAAAAHEAKHANAEGDPRPRPLPLLLWCPSCGVRHVDEGEFATRPHHTHACQHCGMVWRPALVPTVGVRFLPGFKDPPVEASGGAS